MSSQNTQFCRCENGFWTISSERVGIFSFGFFANERYCQELQHIERTLSSNEKHTSYSQTRKNRVFDVFRTRRACKNRFFELDISDKICRRAYGLYKRITQQIDSTHKTRFEGANLASQTQPGFSLPGVLKRTWWSQFLS